MTSMMIVFLIAFLGYVLGNIRVAGVQLGASGVLLVALVFGQYGLQVPAAIRDLGLVCFVTAVGFVAGPVFFRNFKSEALSYIALGILIISAGAGVTILVMKLFHLPSYLAAGIFAGALTTTPGLAAAMEASKSNALVSVGYGIAYPFAVVCKVMFVQLVPKFLKADMNEEVEKLNRKGKIDDDQKNKDARKLKVVDPLGLTPFALAIIFGLLIASINLKLPGGAQFSLGTAGGPLLAGLVIGHFGRIGSYSLKIPAPTVGIMREFGMVLFLMGAGTNAGKGFVDVLMQYGWGLFLMGIAITLIPIVIGFIVAYKLFKMEMLNALGSICGGMTSTPALGALIKVAGTENVAVPYAATYPVALIMVVLAAQLIARML